MQKMKCLLYIKLLLLEMILHFKAIIGDGKLTVILNRAICYDYTQYFLQIEIV